MRSIILIAALLVLHISCQTQKEFKSESKDYNVYLNSETPKTTSKYFELWNGKIKQDSLQAMALGKVAGEYNRFFKETGNILFLKKAEKALTKALEVTALNKAGYMRQLARNYISQHRFKEALQLAESARLMGSGVKETQNLLFDVHMELGHYDKASKYLDSTKNMSDFGHLIRLAKWNDHKGNLDSTIAFMEKAKQKAENSNNKALMVWTYSNLADYYGHAGRIQDSYSHYLKTLELDPKNAHSKKGIAWIVYSYENNAKEALRILDAVSENYMAPDYYLLKHDIANFMDNKKLSHTYLDKYYKLVNDARYGVMYNTAKIEFNIDETNNLKKALQLAQEELNNRATPESYSLLAYAQLKNGNKEEALDIVQEHIIGKTYEPAVLLRACQIYKEMGMNDKVASLKEELNEAIFELGPSSEELIMTL
jgi:hypothetical protein